MAKIGGAYVPTPQSAVGSYASLDPECLRAMNLIVQEARSAGRDYVAQSWPRTRRIQMRVTQQLMKKRLIKGGFLGGPIFQICVWPLPDQEESPTEPLVPEEEIP